MAGLETTGVDEEVVVDHEVASTIVGEEGAVVERRGEAVEAILVGEAVEVDLVGCLAQQVGFPRYAWLLTCFSYSCHTARTGGAAEFAGKKVTF